MESKNQYLLCSGNHITCRIMYPKSEIIKDNQENPQNFTPNIFSELQKTTTQLDQNLLSDLHCCTVHVVSVSSLLFQLMHFTLHFKILKSHAKTLKICPYMFWSPLKPSSGRPWPYFARLLNWNVDLHLL
jgi:hypothetical protein